MRIDTARSLSFSFSAFPAAFTNGTVSPTPPLTTTPWLTCCESGELGGVADNIVESARSALVLMAFGGWPARPRVVIIAGTIPASNSVCVCCAARSVRWRHHKASNIPLPAMCATVSSARIWPSLGVPIEITEEREGGGPERRERRIGTHIGISASKLSNSGRIFTT